MNLWVLRLLDANANRAREALRVWEDYARFIRNDAHLSEKLKAMRHEFAGACAAFGDEAMLQRDTPGDVGTTIKQPTELSRHDLADVVRAAGKRLSEALRSLDEFAKIDHPDASRTFERLRYTAYEIERQIGLTLRGGARMADIRLCVLLTESLCRVHWYEAAEQIIAGGAGCIQLREKEMDGGELLRRAGRLVALCRSHNVLCIINDRTDIAQLADADGVHVGQTDLPATAVRRLIGSDRIVGVSTHELAHAQQAEKDGADYIGIGPVFRSSTKPRDILPGLDYARQVAHEIHLPAMAIAGITLDNLDEVLATGVRRIAVSSAVLSTDDIRSTTRAFADRLSRAQG